MSAVPSASWLFLNRRRGSRCSVMPNYKALSYQKAKWKLAFGSAPSMLRSEEPEYIFARCISAYCGVMKAFSVQKEDRQTIKVARGTEASVLPGFHFAVHSWALLIRCPHCPIRAGTHTPEQVFQSCQCSTQATAVSVVSVGLPFVVASVDMFSQGFSVRRSVEPIGE